MNLDSDVILPDESGHHVTLEDKSCPGRTFRVVMVGSGGIYYNVVRCPKCNRQFKMYGDHILDPFAERLIDLPDESAAVAGIKMSYRYRHGTVNGQSDLPVKWFNDLGRAIDAFNDITQEAVAAAWPRHDAGDVLTNIVVELYRKGNNEWERVDRKEYTLA